MRILLLMTARKYCLCHYLNNYQLKCTHLFRYGDSAYGTQNPAPLFNFYLKFVTH